MKSRNPGRPLRAMTIIVLGIGSASLSMAVRVDGAAVPAASAVSGSPQQAAKQQADESASLRQGVISALDERGTRLQVQGIWLEVVAGRTQVLRNGQPVPFDTLKIGDAIRFTVAPGAGEGQALRVIYAP
jgi:hypothetical protein